MNCEKFTFSHPREKSLKSRHELDFNSIFTFFLHFFSRFRDHAVFKCCWVKSLRHDEIQS